MVRFAGPGHVEVCRLIYESTHHLNNSGELIMIFKQESDILTLFFEKCHFPVENGSKKSKNRSERTD